MARNSGVLSLEYIRSEGGLLPADLLEKIRQADSDLEGLGSETYHLGKGERFGEVTTSGWNRLLAAWAGFSEGRAALGEGRADAGLTRDKWLITLFEVLGYGRLPAARGGLQAGDESVPISHAWSASPIHLVGFRTDLDKRTAGVAGAARQSPHSLVQGFLNASDDHLWGFLSNGLKLRILRDSASLTRQAYLEFDLEGMMEGDAYATFVLLWMVAHSSRVEAEAPEDCWLERWSREARLRGTRALDSLRGGVEAAIKTLGAGYLAHSGNTDLKDALRSGTLPREEYYRELLRLVYRLLFLFVAEDRGLLFDPAATAHARGVYNDHYSTQRLRRLAGQRRGTVHVDVYRGLRAVMDQLSGGGYKGLGLPALGSFLWSPDAMPHLSGADIANRDLLEAIRKLAFTEQGRVLRGVDFRNLGAEELGSIYESLLELVPEVNEAAGEFALVTAGGSERKTTGSYYTPTALIESLLDTALKPVLAEAESQPDAEAAILRLKVCDPACGSGHFLIGAAHRLAKRLAMVRTGEGDPAPEPMRAALRDVVGHCLYGVDINPMAVELCKVSLWLEALEPGKPLSFLDHKIQCGNSLLGTTPRLLAEGIPQAAFKPIAGDDKTIARARADQNKAEGRDANRESQVSFLSQMAAESPADYGGMGARLRSLDALPDGDVAGVREKETLYAKLRGSEAYQQARRVADGWCAAFLGKKVADGPEVVTQDTLRRLQQEPGTVPAEIVEEIDRLSAQYQLFHWHMAFPDVFEVPNEGEAPLDEAMGWSGGFDVMLGNPPWERIKIQEKEWFATRDPEIAKAPTAAKRRKRIAALEETDPPLFAAFREAGRQAEGESQLVRTSGRYPLCGRGDVNTYTIFAETMRDVLSPRGRLGCIVPSGIATDDTTKYFFQDLVEKGSLVSLYDFENAKAIFPGVHRSYKFCLLTLAGREAPASQGAQFSFFAHDVADLKDPERCFELTAEDIRLLNPNTRTCPVFRTRRDAEITKAIYRRVPVLIEEGQPEKNPWEVTFKQGLFNMASDSGLFRTCEELENEGWMLHGNVFHKGRERYLPLYEGKMLQMMNHRGADIVVNNEVSQRKAQPRRITSDLLHDPERLAMPNSWVHEPDCIGALTTNWASEWFFGFASVTSPTNTRSFKCAFFPRSAVGNSLPLILPSRGLGHFPLCGANFSSFVADYALRQKLGGVNLNFFYVEQSPILAPAEYERQCPWDAGGTVGDWMRSRVLELVYTAWDLEGFARDSSYVGPPFRWDEARRFLLRCELDAAFFHLYGIARDDVDYIMETFPIVKRKDLKVHGEYRTKRQILEIFDALQVAIDAGTAYETLLSPPPADPSLAHPPREA